MSYIQQIGGDIDLIDALPRGVARGQAATTTGAFLTAATAINQYVSVMSIRGKTGLGEIRLYELIHTMGGTNSPVA